MRILLASSISEKAKAVLAEDHQLVEPKDTSESSLIEHITSCDGLIFRSGPQISAAVLDAASNLKFIVRAGSGYDNIDLPRLAEMQVHVFRLPSPGAKAVAEMAFAMMLSLARNLRWADEQWRGGNWVKSQATGTLLQGQTLGIVGAGNIGSQTGRLGAAWGMNVIGCVAQLSDEQGNALRRNGVTPTSFDEVIGTSDFVAIHVPLLPSTRRLIGRKELERMKPGVVIVNLSRGGVLDESALRDALLSGHVRGAGLDVHEHEGNGHISPLADLENVILTPHIGASTIETQDEIGELIVKCIARVQQTPAPIAREENFVVL